MAWAAAGVRVEVDDESCSFLYFRAEPGPHFVTRTKLIENISPGQGNAWEAMTRTLAAWLHGERGSFCFSMLVLLKWQNKDSQMGFHTLCRFREGGRISGDWLFWHFSNSLGRLNCIYEWLSFFCPFLPRTDTPPTPPPPTNPLKMATANPLLADVVLSLGAAVSSFTEKSALKKLVDKHKGRIGYMINSEVRCIFLPNLFMRCRCSNQTKIIDYSLHRR